MARVGARKPRTRGSRAKARARPTSRKATARWSEAAGSEGRAHQQEGEGEAHQQKGKARARPTSRKARGRARRSSGGRLVLSEGGGWPIRSGGSGASELRAAGFVGGRGGGWPIRGKATVAHRCQRQKLRAEHTCYVPQVPGLDMSLAWRSERVFSIAFSKYSEGERSVRRSQRIRGSCMGRAGARAILKSVRGGSGARPSRP